MEKEIGISKRGLFSFRVNNILLYGNLEYLGGNRYGKEKRQLRDIVRFSSDGVNRRLMASMDINQIFKKPLEDWGISNEVSYSFSRNLQWLL